jgi:hypothetical protein
MRFLGRCPGWYALPLSAPLTDGVGSVLDREVDFPLAGYAGPGFHTWPSGHIPQDPDLKPFLCIRPHVKKTFGEAFGAATGVSDPSYRRTVAHAPLPSGHRYETTTQVSLLPDEGKWDDDDSGVVGPPYFRYLTHNGASRPMGLVWTHWCRWYGGGSGIVSKRDVRCPAAHRGSRYGASIVFPIPERRPRSRSHAL